MKVIVEWLDGVERIYTHIDELTLSTAGNLLTLHRRRPYAGREPIASVPLEAVREYRREDD